MYTLLAVDFKSVMQSVGGVVIAILILLAMITIHEFGHYVAGKILHFKITEFSIGFGPAIFKRRSKKSGEIFALRVIPLGGYCAFDGEDYDEEEEQKRTVREPVEEPFAEMNEEATHVLDKEEDDGGMSEDKTGQEEEYPEPKGERFNDQAPWKRIIVLIAGATMNYLLGLLLLIIMFSVYGCVHPYVAYKGEGDAPTLSEEVLQANDLILSVDGEAMYTASDYSNVLSGKKAGDVVTLEILRKDAQDVWQEKTLNVTLLTDCHFKNMNDLAAAYTAFGLEEAEYVYVNVAGITNENFFETIGYSFVYSFKLAGLVLRSLGELITFKLGVDAVGGPVSTIQTTAELAIKGGAFSTLHIAALIGVNLAVFNLLPVPALDGSKVIFCIIEWIRKKPVNRKVETMIHFIGIIFLFAFAILVDILHFIP